MDFETTLKLLQQAQDDPQALALTTHDILLSSQPESLRRAVEAAAVPHWFDANILRQLLDPDLQPAAEQWYGQIVNLPFCERFAQRGGHNLHESTRLALRKRLHREMPERLQSLSRRAADVFSENTVHARIENAFHQLWADPENAGPLIRRLEHDLSHKVEHSLALAATLQECATDDAATPPLVAAWAIWTIATVRQPFLSVVERLKLAQRMLALAEQAKLPYAQAAASNLVADALVEHGHGGDTAQALSHYQRSLELRDRLLAANPESADAARDVSVSLMRLGDFLAGRGLAGDAEQALGLYQRSLDVNQRLLAANAESALAARDVSLSLSRLGDVLARRGMPGDTDEALGHYQRSLEMDERLLAANPESAQAARDVSVSLNKMGDFLARRGLRGDAEQALGHYTRSLEVADRLLAANPESAQAARDMSVSLERLADFLARRGLPGDAEQALGHYLRSLDVAERLWAANPESAVAARDVSVCLECLGDFLVGRGSPGDAEQALGHYQRGFEVRESLLAANPESAQAARDVAVSLERLGDFLAGRGLEGDAEHALGHYQRSLEVRERLLAANPGSARAARDVSLSLSRLGDFLAGRGLPGDAEQALALYQRSLEVGERLLAANPDSAEAQRDVLVWLERLAKTEGEREGGADAALGLQVRSLELALKLRERNPQFYYHQRTAAVSFFLTGQRAQAAGNQGLADRSFAGCRGVLDSLIQAGVELDPLLRQIDSDVKQFRSASEPPESS